MSQELYFMDPHKAKVGYGHEPAGRGHLGKETVREQCSVVQTYSNHQDGCRVTGTTGAEN